MTFVKTFQAILLTSILLAFSLNTHAAGWALQDKDGVNYTLSGLQGRWVLVNFWAPWCPPCLQEIPELAALQKSHKDMQVIGVAVLYKSRQNVLDMAKDMTYPVVLGNEDIASDFGGMTGLPTSFLYTPDGKLLGHHSGPLTQEQVEKTIKNSDTTLFIP